VVLSDFGYPVEVFLFTCSQRLSNLVIMSVPDERYSRNTLHALSSISTFLLRHFQQYYIYVMAASFIGCEKNPTNLPEVTEILEHTRLYRVHLVTRVRRSQQIKPYNRDRQCKLSITVGVLDTDITSRSNLTN
jgi:hypothetical protein